MPLDTNSKGDSQNTLTTPLATYSHSRWVGDLLFIAGQGSRNPITNQEAGLTWNDDGTLSGYDIKAQTRGVFDNLDRVLKKEGLSRKDLVDVTVFLVDMNDFHLMNFCWNDYFDQITPPTRTTVAVKALPGHNFVEMKAIACRP